MSLSQLPKCSIQLTKTNETFLGHYDPEWGRYLTSKEHSGLGFCQVVFPTPEMLRKWAETKTTHSEARRIRCQFSNPKDQDVVSFPELCPQDTQADSFLSKA